MSTLFPYTTLFRSCAHLARLIPRARRAEHRMAPAKFFVRHVRVVLAHTLFERAAINHNDTAFQPPVGINALIAHGKKFFEREPVFISSGRIIRNELPAPPLFGRE